MSYRQNILVAVAVLAVLSGCTGGGILSPQVDYDDPSARSPDYRTVIRGDTVFSVAWDVGVDFRALARWNSISPPYVIRPGQRLRVVAPKEKGPVEDEKAVVGKITRDEFYRVRRGDTVYSIARKADTSSRNIIAWNRLKKPYVIRPGQRLRVTPAGRPAVTSTASAKTGRSRNRARIVEREPTGRPQRVGKWIWPTAGKVLRSFSPRGASKGIDIAGSRGQDIHAAASGTVVYQGSGLRGYGKLIIVKHNADYLSAYAHCSSILVKEGSKVKRGQRIAAMGSTGTDRVMLHFEIRLRGNPVNPVKYLPRKF